MRKWFLLAFLILGIGVASFTFATGEKQGCTDSDMSNGDQMMKDVFDNSVFTKGTVSVGLNKFEDSCDGSRVNERTCQADGSIGTYSYECPSGCSNGACLGSATESNPLTGFAAAEIPKKMECRQDYIGTSRCDGNELQFCFQDKEGNSIWKTAADCADSSASCVQDGIVATCKR